MSKYVIDSIYENIEQLRSRIEDTREFKISVRYYKGDEMIEEVVSKKEFIKIVDEQAKEGLWILVAENQGNFIQAFLIANKETDHNFEKVLMEIDKIPLALNQTPSEESIPSKVDKTTKEPEASVEEEEIETQSDPFKIEGEGILPEEMPLKDLEDIEVQKTNQEDLEENEVENLLH